MNVKVRVAALAILSVELFQGNAVSAAEPPLLPPLEAAPAAGQTLLQPPHRGRGFGRGRRGVGRGRGRMLGGGMRADATTLHAMFDARDKIRRTVKMLPDGAEAVTESDDKQVAELLQEHVPSMETRVHRNEPLPPMTFHPVFIQLIKHADDYTLQHEETQKGVKVRYTAKDPLVIMLVQEHAKLVSRFIKNGMQEIHKPYQLPRLPPQKAGREAAKRRPPRKAP